MRPLLQVLGFILLGLLTSCNRPSSPDRPSASEPPLPVSTAVVETHVAPRLQSVAGTVRPVERAVLSARVMGRVERIHVPLGGAIPAGSAAVTLQAAEIEARLEQARATLDQVTRDLARETTLVSQGASSVETARTLEDRRRAAAAAVNEAATLWSYTTVTAPFAGVITRRLVEEGDLAVPGAPLLELEALDRLRAEVEVPESLTLLAPGTSVGVQLDDTVVSGRLAELSPAADPVSRTRLAKIELPADAPARSGQFVRVLWPAGESRVLLVPSAAVTRFGQMERVFVVEQGRAHLRLVRTGSQRGGHVEILAGVNAGEIVVLNPSASLRDGGSVETRP